MAVTSGSILRHPLSYQLSRISWWRCAHVDYDAAHRLTKTTDTDGNSVVYTLDGAGNRTAEQTDDAQQTLVLGKSRAFDALGRLASELGSAGQTVSYGYDGAGNRTSLMDPMGRVTGYDYDELNRLAAVTDAMYGLTQFSYDARDDLLVLLPSHVLRVFFFETLACPFGSLVSSCRYFDKRYLNPSVYCSWLASGVAFCM